MYIAPFKNRESALQTGQEKEGRTLNNRRPVSPNILDDFLMN